MFSTWLYVLTHPSEATFAAERLKPNAKLSTALIWMAIAAVVAGIVALIQGFVFRNSVQSMGGLTGIMEQFGLPTEMTSLVDQAQVQALVEQRLSPGAIVFSAIGSIFWVLVGFLIGVGILFLIARVFGGTGNYGTYAFLIAAYTAPLNIVSSLVGMVPAVGGCVAMLIAIYGLVLTYFATRAEHGLSQGKAIAVILTPLLIAIVLVLCAGIALGGIIASIFSGGN